MIELTAGTREASQRQAVVVIVYRHRLFRDVVAQVLRRDSVLQLEATRSRDEAVMLVADLGARRITLVVECEARLSLERGALASFLRDMQNDTRVRVIAVTLGGAGVSFRRWQWLERIDADQLMQEILAD